jgi:pimeloyl-ACP methyl ester carboxylesterase
MMNSEVVSVTTEPSAEREDREWIAPVNGAALRVEEVGGGTQTVVFSNALFTNRALFDVPVAALSGDHRCIRYDHRGQGDSGVGAPQSSPDRLGTEGLYEDAVALLDELGVESCHWVGASVGGFVGIRLAARHPDRVRSLTLIGFSRGPMSRADARSINLMFGMVRLGRLLGPVGTAMLRRVCEQVMRNMFGPTFMSDPERSVDRELWRQRFTAQLVPEAIPMLRQVFDHHNPPELLAGVQVPTLIIVGEEDVGGPGDALEAQRAIPDARLVTVEGAGHMVLVEQPEAGTTAITEFIRAVEAG